MAQKVRATSQLAPTNSRYACHLFTRWPSDERHGSPTNIWVYYERVRWLARGSFVSTTANGHGVADRHTMEPDSGDCIEMQVALRPTTRISRVDWGMGVLQMDNIQVKLNRLPMIGNTMILVRLENRT